MFILILQCMSPLLGVHGIILNFGMTFKSMLPISLYGFGLDNISVPASIVLTISEHILALHAAEVDLQNLCPQIYCIPI